MTVRRYKGVAVLAVMFLLICTTLPTVSATTGYPDHLLNVATEPTGTSEYVKYFKDGVETPLEELPWVDGGVRGGKALDLNGKNTYLWIGEDQLRTAQFTFSTWINFRGSANPEDPQAAYNQRLFTIGDELECYFTVSPHAVHDGIVNEQGSLDGVYMEYFSAADNDAAQTVHMQAFSGVEKGVSHFGLPRNEWHHMAVVVETQAVKLYIDGNLIFSEDVLVPISQMSAAYMTIGGGLWNNPTLNALLDDVMMFDMPLTHEQVKALMQTGNVAASLSDPAAVITTQTVYMPTAPTAAPTTTTTVPTPGDAQRAEGPFGLPLWGLGVVIGLLVLFAALTVIVNIYEIRVRRAAESPVLPTDETSQAEEEHHDEN